VIAATSSRWLRYACWPLERNLKSHEWRNPVSNLKCCATMVLRVAPHSSPLFPSLGAKLRILWQQVRTVRH
jgi:hypothetical protein